LILPFIPRRTDFAEIIEELKKFLKFFSFVIAYSFHSFLIANEWAAHGICPDDEKCRKKKKTPRGLLSFPVLFIFREKKI